MCGFSGTGEDQTLISAIILAGGHQTLISAISTEKTIKGTILICLCFRTEPRTKNTTLYL